MRREAVKKKESAGGFVLSFFASLRTIRVLVLALALAAIIWFREALASAVFETLGLGIVLVLVGLGALAWFVWRLRSIGIVKGFDPLVRRWNWVLGVVLLSLAAWGLLAFFQPEGFTIGGASLTEATLGGIWGQYIIGSTGAQGILRLIGLTVVGIGLIAPRPVSRLLWVISRWLGPLLRAAMIAVARAAPVVLRFTLRLLSRSARQLALLALDLGLKIGTWLRERRRAPEAAPAEEFVPEVAEPIAAEPIAEAPTEREPEETTIAQPAPALEPEEPPEPAEPVEKPRRLTLWPLPPADLLELTVEANFMKADNEQRARFIEEALKSYGVEAKVTQINPGPTVTQFGVEPGWDRKYRRVAEKDRNGKPVLDENGVPRVRLEETSKTRVKVDRIASLSNDLALALSAPSLRIEAPVPGKAIVGIEVPNSATTLVPLRTVIDSPAFQRLISRSNLALALGKGAGGEAAVCDLSRMPHLLIAGATGSGKTVCLTSIITCLLMHSTPEEVRLLLIDPKRVELTVFNHMPHLISPVVVETKGAIGALKRVAQEMETRYHKLAEAGARNIETYNKSPQVKETLPYLVIIIDELADIMMTAPDVVEPTLCRLAQLSRATGIHLVIATQRPSVDVITGLIKANFPARISFAVTSSVDSRTILDTGGAEKLLGRGDMLYLPPEAAKPKRLQGVFVSDHEIERVISFWKGLPATLAKDTVAQAFTSLKGEASAVSEKEDSLLEEAKRLAEEHASISTSFLQRRLRIGYPRAARLMDLLEEEGVVHPAEPGKSREVVGKGFEEEN